MPDPANPLNYINPFSRCVVHLTMDFGGERIATGTGFIRQRKGERFLITAWHNLSGREPATLRPKHRQGALPNYATIEGFNITIRCPLYYDDDPNDEVHCQRCFWQHPLGPTLDVAVLRISSSSSAGLPIDESFFDPQQNEQSPLWVTKSCIVIGFPLGLVDRSQAGHLLPIYKGAQIASEPYVDFQGRPIVVIDATTRPGMSGAPVFAQELTYRGQYTAGRFLGVYTGRFRDSEGAEDSALGFVFKPRVIDEMFQTIRPFIDQSERGFVSGSQ